MKEFVLPIIVGLITSLLYDSIKKSLTSIINTDTIKETTYNLRSIKLQFYICFPVGISCLILPRLENEFFSTFIRIIAFFSLFMALSSFMCVIEIIDNMSHNGSDDDK